MRDCVPSWVASGIGTVTSSGKKIFKESSTLISFRVTFIFVEIEIVCTRRWVFIVMTYWSGVAYSMWFLLSIIVLLRDWDVLFVVSFSNKSLGMFHEWMPHDRPLRSRLHLQNRRSRTNAIYTETGSYSVKFKYTICKNKHSLVSFHCSNIIIFRNFIEYSL